MASSWGHGQPVRWLMLAFAKLAPHARSLRLSRLRLRHRRCDSPLRRFVVHARRALVTAARAMGLRRHARSVRPHGAGPLWDARVAREHHGRARRGRGAHRVDDCDARRDPVGLRASRHSRLAPSLATAGKQARSRSGNDDPEAGGRARRRNAGARRVHGGARVWKPTRPTCLRESKRSPYASPDFPAPSTATPSRRSPTFTRGSSWAPASSRRGSPVCERFARTSS